MFQSERQMPIDSDQHFKPIKTDQDIHYNNWSDSDQRYKTAWSEMSNNLIQTWSIPYLILIILWWETDQRLIRYWSGTDQKMIKNTWLKLIRNCSVSDQTFSRGIHFPMSSLLESRSHIDFRQGVRMPTKSPKIHHFYERIQQFNIH